MDYNDPNAVRIRELQAEASRLEREARTKKNLAAVENFKQIEGWEKLVTDAVLTALHAGETGGSVELCKLEWPPSADPLKNVSAWVSFSVSPAWLQHEVDLEAVKHYGTPEEEGS